MPRLRGQCSNSSASWPVLPLAANSIYVPAYVSKNNIRSLLVDATPPQLPVTRRSEVLVGGSASTSSFSYFSCSHSSLSKQRHQVRYLDVAPESVLSLVDTASTEAPGVLCLSHADSDSTAQSDIVQVDSAEAFRRRQSAATVHRVKQVQQVQCATMLAEPALGRPPTQLADDHVTCILSEERSGALEIGGVSFAWGNTNGDVFMKSILSAYEEVVHWRRNLFLVPSGSTGKSFVRELARLIRTLAEDSALAPVAMTAIMTMPHLLLQKPTPKSRSKDHVLHLDRRLIMWRAGNIEGLMEESRAILVRLVTQHSRNESDRMAAKFAKLMFKGRTRAAMRLLD